MDELERVFHDITGRSAKPNELKTLGRIQKTMRLSDSDAVWWVIVLCLSQGTSARALSERIERASERYAKVIHDAGTQAEKILDDARSDLRAATGAKPGTGQQVVGALFVLAILGCIVYGIFQLGHSFAVFTVREYDSGLATRIFDAPGLSVSDYKWARSDEGPEGAQHGSRWPTRFSRNVVWPTGGQGAPRGGRARLHGHHEVSGSGDRFRPRRQLPRS